MTLRRFWSAVRERVTALVSRRRFESALDEELRYHLDEAIARHRRRGLSPEVARTAAARQLGSIAATKDAVRDEAGLSPLRDLGRDVHHGLRLLGRRPGLSATIVLTTGIGVGVCASLFTVVHHVLLAPLPFPDAGRIVRLFNVYPGAAVPRTSTSVPEFLDRRDQARTLVDLALYREESNTIDSAAGGRHTFALRVTASFFRLLDLRTTHGRVFTDADMAPGAPAVVIVSHHLWQSLGADPDLVGSSLSLNGTAFTVVGVLPESFRFPSWDAHVLTPIGIGPADAGLRARHTDAFQMIGRLAPGASLEEAQADIARLNDAAVAAYPADLHQRVTEAGYATVVAPYLADMTRDVRAPLMMLWAAGAIVFVIAITNVATLLLLRTYDRHHELAVRSALGAGRYRLGRAVFIESLVPILAGGGLGYVLATMSLRLLSAFEVYELPRVAGLAEAGIGFWGPLVLVGLSGAIVGGVTVVAALRARPQVGTGRRVTTVTRWPQLLLVGGQISFAVMLVLTASLLVTSLRNLQSVDPGFDADGVSIAAIIVPGQRYPTSAARADVISRVLAAIEATPGVSRAAAASQLPFSGGTTRMPFSPDLPTTAAERLVAPFGTTVSDGYFETVGIRVVSGRPLLPSDRLGTERVAVIDETVARRYWPDGAVGRRFWAAAQPGSFQEATRIVGVVETVRQQSLRDQDPPGAVYSPMAQMPSNFIRLAVKHHGTRDWPSVVRQIASVDKDFAPFWTGTLEGSVSESLLFQRRPMELLSVFAVAGLLLGALGVYGVLSHEFRGRRREIAIRLALGGRSRDIVRLVSRRWLGLVGAGIAAGLAGAIGSIRLFESLLFGIAATDLRLIATVIGIVAAVAAVAALGPIRRVARVDPASFLRQ